MSVSTKIHCDQLWKIFGAKEQQVFAQVDKTASRDEVQQQTGHVIAVKDVSFDIREGETFVVMGLSGSGKSTLVRCISRLIEPTTGQVVIDGDDVTAMSKSQLVNLRRHKMSMVFQHFGLFSHRTVLNNIGYGLEVRGVGRKERVDKSMEVLEMVGLGGWENNYPRELSGGMQQRVGLARAMAVDPEILIFDEPFSALDPLIRREMQDELLKIQSLLKKTMVFITHDFLEAIKMGDHIAIMKDGEVAQIGTPEELVAAPADDYVREFTEDVPRYRVLSASKVMRPIAQTIAIDTSVDSARNAVDNAANGCVFVTASDGQVIGSLSASEFNGADNATLESIVNRQVARVSGDAKLDELIDDTLDHDHPLPVVDDAGLLIGEIDRTIIIRAMNARV